MQSIHWTTPSQPQPCMQLPGCPCMHARKHIASVQSARPGADSDGVSATEGSMQMGASRSLARKPLPSPAQRLDPATTHGAVSSVAVHDRGQRGQRDRNSWPRLRRLPVYEVMQFANYVLHFNETSQHLQCMLLVNCSQVNCFITYMRHVLA
jgi:hypothetical protein